jgi:hypothetical protein
MESQDLTLGGGAGQTGTAAPGSLSRADRIAQLRKELAELEAEAELDTTTPLGVLRGIGATMYERECRMGWTGSPLESINKLKPDNSGKVGELFVTNMCAKAGIDCVYTEDVNSTDGTYDAVINGKKVEIKTARLGVQKGFQHESLRSSGCDYYLFLDILPTGFYMTVLASFDLTKQHPVIGRAPHCRKGTTDVFKFDFSEKNIQSAIKEGVAIKVDASTPMESIAEFLRKVIV